MCYLTHNDPSEATRLADTWVSDAFIPTCVWPWVGLAPLTGQGFCFTCPVMISWQWVVQLA